MKLPSGNQAVVEVEKLTEYCLNPDHEHGRDKARVFDSALGLTLSDASWLRERLLEAARDSEARPGRLDSWGQRYTVDFAMTRDRRTALVRSGWIIRNGEETPRLTTCYILK